MGFDSGDRLGGASTKVASVDCLRGISEIILVGGLISGEAASLMPPVEVEGSSRHGFSSSINSSDDTFHGDKAMASPTRSPGETECSKVIREDEFPADDRFSPVPIPSGESLSADSRILPDVMLSEALSDSSLRVLEGNIPHFLREESDNLPGSLFDIVSSSGRVGPGGLFAKT